MIYLDLIFNVTLLIALSIVSGFIEKRWPRHTRLGALLQGVLFGTASVLGMIRPFTLYPGIIVDGRSIMVSLCALFFGPWSATAATGIVLGYRIWLGGTGMVTGLLLILAAAGIGLVAHFRLKPEVKPPSVGSLYLFGLTVHLATLATMFTLPMGVGPSVLRQIGLPVILLFPLATILVGKILSDQVEAKRSAQALADSEAKMRSILENIGIGVSLISPKMEILELNRQMREWFPAIDQDQRPICYKAFNDPPREDMCNNCPTYRTLQDGMVHIAITETPRAEGIRNYRIVSSPIFNASHEVTAIIETVEDITKQKQADEENIKLQEQLAQAQKLESIGQLAGGVAHDFNNMLSVILGYTQLALMEVAPTDPLYFQLQEIDKAAQRSRDLTGQLLAFARKQTITPLVLNLNETISGMLKMLQRLIGEDIELSWIPGTEVWSVKVDPSQIDQVLANLCINARDSITGMGKITIETSNCTFDESYCTNHQGFVPGDYILLATSDDGCGMDKETQRHMFEPFFTTKGPAKGTGLGLATVYGIVKQNAGFVNVYSESGLGTTIKIYFPRHKDDKAQTGVHGTADVMVRGTETVLIVEDEESILDLCATILKLLGYTPLTAKSPEEAILLFKKHADGIQLLLTDVVMPEMTGRNLAERLVSMKPGLKCLYMSGYTSNIIAHRGILEEGIHFIPKPISMKELAIALRKALDHIPSDDNNEIG